MKHSIMNRGAIHALLATSVVLVFACGAPAGAGEAEASESVMNSDPRYLPDALYGDWHEDYQASMGEKRVFVPQSVALGPAHYRQTLHFGRDGSFAMLRLHPADAHYLCRGTFAATGPSELLAQCWDPMKNEDLALTIRVVEAREDRLVVQMSL